MKISLEDVIEFLSESIEKGKVVLKTYTEALETNYVMTNESYEDTQETKRVLLEVTNETKAIAEKINYLLSLQEKMLSAVDKDLSNHKSKLN